MSSPYHETFRPPAFDDLQGRKITYLRVSVTDRCNFTCTYCIPREGTPASPRSEILSFEEVERLVRLFASLAVHKVRITGGEPLIRKDIVRLAQRIAAVPGIEDVAMTTNAYILDRVAKQLREAGVTRLNISLDSIDPGEFAELSRGQDVARVIAGIDAALAAGFDDIKTNAVVVRGVNDGSAVGLVEWCWDRGLTPRFIELMPMGEAGRMVAAGQSVPNQEVRQMLGYRIEAEPRGSTSGQGPAVYFPRRSPAPQEDTGRPQMVGFIGALTESFCADCNRVRLTASGELRPCLASLQGISLRDLLRGGATDHEILDTISQTLYGKAAGHEFAEGVGANGSIDMVRIGG